MMEQHINKAYKHSDITAKVIGCCMKVHSVIGNGFQEAIYQRCLEIEMEKQGLSFTREQEMSIYYDDIEVGIRRVDFFVEGKVMLELKAVSKLDDTHLAQAINYLEAYGLGTGLLINFGAKSLEFKRVTNEHKLKNKDR